jgi:hypothetical protein
MLVIHNNIIIEIEKELDENIEEFNKRKIFIIKNLDSGYKLKDVIDLSHIYKNKMLLCCVYEEYIEDLIKLLQVNVFIS